MIVLLDGPVSGAHLNPVVSLADWWLGRRRGTGLPLGEVGAYAAAQVAGGILGAILANLMFDLSAITGPPTTAAAPTCCLEKSWRLPGWVALVFSLARSGHGALSAAAIAAFIGSAYFFTSSTSFANPAVTVARMFSDTFAGIAPASVLPFVLAQLLGAAIGVGIVLGLYPDVAASADDVVVPHEVTEASRA